MRAVLWPGISPELIHGPLDCQQHLIAAGSRPHLTPTISASSVISQSTENASRSTPERRLQMSSVSGLGSMSMRRCTRYTVVPLQAAVEVLPLGVRSCSACKLAASGSKWPCQSPSLPMQSVVLILGHLAVEAFFSWQ